MEIAVQQYFEAGLAPATRRTYQSGINSFIQFCTHISANPLAISQSTLCSYVAYLARRGMAYQTIKTYVAAVRHLQIAHERPVCLPASMPKLRLVMAGVQRTQAFSRQQKPRLPITTQILREIRALWWSKADDYDTIMLWAACCLCFFGFFRMGEITSPSATGFDPATHLMVADIAVDSLQAPSMVQLHLKRSKTDQLGRGVNVVVGRTDDDLCPVAGTLAYLAVRGTSEGPLFLCKDGKPLTKCLFIEKVREALSALGYNQSHYAGHSFRIGAATTAAAKGLEDSTIRALGRWSSGAFQSYIRIPRQHLASFSKRLAN